jgi:hypothetical protein
VSREAVWRGPEGGGDFERKPSVHKLIAGCESIFINCYFNLANILIYEHLKRFSN